MTVRGTAVASTEISSANGHPVLDPLEWEPSAPDVEGAEPLS